MSSWISECWLVGEMYMIQCTPLRCTPILELVGIMCRVRGIWWVSDVRKVFELLKYMWYSAFPLRCTPILMLVGIIFKTYDTWHVGEFVRFRWYWWTHSRCTYLKWGETMLRVRGLSMGSWFSEGRWVDEMYMIQCTPLRCTPILELAGIIFKTCAF